MHRRWLRNLCMSMSVVVSVVLLFSSSRAQEMQGDDYYGNPPQLLQYAQQTYPIDDMAILFNAWLIYTLDQYQKECYNDSSHVWADSMLPEDMVWHHRKPTIEGFTEFLKRRSAR